ncbi:MAG: Flp pilus assembly complex ATPase component TadA [Methylophaga sp.]|nr:Flp pilus assembly complex ATPase component TadA [Methylophaga sp.]
MDIKKRIRIGDLLVENKLISESQLTSALTEQKKTRRKLGRTLIDLGYIEESQLLRLLSKQLKIPYLDLRQHPIDLETFHSLPEIYARRFRAIALSKEDGKVLVGMADPTDIYAYDELQKVLKSPIDIAAISETDLLKHIDADYRKTDQIDSLAEVLDDELAESDFDLQSITQSTSTADAPVVKLLQAIFEDAVATQASDIHIEPDATVLRIRQRIDGVLQEQIVDETRIANALTSRLKLMASLNISEKRLPQDGRFNIKVNKKNIDVRLSTMPTVHGESVVMRLLDHSKGMLDFSKLGIPDNILLPLRQLIKKPHGLILVTGPTGSGKTTTLYAALNEINTPETKIITAEDPVEYQLPRINQVQIHNKIGLTFPTVLRTALRQDPDVILIGEMRDQETAEIGLRAAMTGHLVFSTLHTNDAISTVSRLLDMGAEDFLLASSLQAVMAQRLVRRLCPECHKPHTLDEQEQHWLSQLLGSPTQLPELYQAVGCHQCKNIGYKGRVGVYELLVMTAELTDALQQGNITSFIALATQQQQNKTLASNAVELAKQGITSLDEIIRIAGDLDINVPSNTAVK